MLKSGGQVTSVVSGHAHLYQPRALRTKILVPEFGASQGAEITAQEIIQAPQTHWEHPLAQHLHRRRIRNSLMREQRWAAKARSHSRYKRADHSCRAARLRLSWVTVGLGEIVGKGGNPCFQSAGGVPFASGTATCTDSRLHEMKKADLIIDEEQPPSSALRLPRRSFILHLYC